MKEWASEKGEKVPVSALAMVEIRNQEYSNNTLGDYHRRNAKHVTTDNAAKSN